MKNISFLIIITGLLFSLSCKKTEKSERFILLTTPTWTTDSLLANGEDASGPDQILEKFKGNAKFREDGTGTFGVYKGQWWLISLDTQITIKTDSLSYPIITNIVMLTIDSLKVTTVVPDKITLDPINIRMIFSAK